MDQVPLLETTRRLARTIHDAVATGDRKALGIALEHQRNFVKMHTGQLSEQTRTEVLASLNNAVLLARLARQHCLTELQERQRVGSLLRAYKPHA